MSQFGEFGLLCVGQRNNLCRAHNTTKIFLHTRTRPGILGQHDQASRFTDPTVTFQRRTLEDTQQVENTQLLQASAER